MSGLRGLGEAVGDLVGRSGVNAGIDEGRVWEVDWTGT